MTVLYFQGRCGIRAVHLMPSTSGNLIALVGPTASGKTAAAIKLAQLLGGEIICADSRTVYRGLDIATAKPTKAEQQLVPHHLLDVVDPDESFTVAQFKQQAEEAIIAIRSRGCVPIIVGGSGLYVDALLYNYSFSQSSSGRDKVNPRHAAVTSTHNRQPLMSGVNYVGINPGREILRQRIMDRTIAMAKNGLVEEALWLRDSYPTSKALDAPAYRALSTYLDGTISLDEALEQFITRDFQLARRQMTWFKRNPDIQWFETPETVVAYVANSYT